MEAEAKNREVSDATARVWLVRAGGRGEDEDTALENSIALIGWQEVPDLTGVRTKDEMRRRLLSWREDPPPNAVAQLTAFAVSMQAGDIVALPLKTRVSQVALGRIKGSYAHQEINGVKRHARPVTWIRTDVPRAHFGQDLLYSLGSLLTVCQIQRNEAGQRIAAILNGRQDPGIGNVKPLKPDGEDNEPVVDDQPNIGDVAHQQILTHVRSKFTGHELARLVEGVLKAEGYFTQLSPPGPDGGVDVLAGQGPGGFESPRICVQVKATANPTDVDVFRSLQGALTTFNADQGILVSWGGFTASLKREARQSFFKVRLWDANDLLNAIYRNYERLSEQIRAEIPLSRVWTLVADEDAT